MPAFAADEDFDGRILRRARGLLPELVVVRVQDVGLTGAPDEAVVAWAGESGLPLLTHNARHMVVLATQRMAAGEPMPGLVVVRQSAPRAAVVEDLILLSVAGVAGELSNQIVFLPL